MLITAVPKAEEPNMPPPPRKNSAAAPKYPKLAPAVKAAKPIPTAIIKIPPEFFPAPQIIGTI